MWGRFRITQFCLRMKMSILGLAALVAWSSVRTHGLDDDDSPVWRANGADEDDDDDRGFPL